MGKIRNGIKTTRNNTKYDLYSLRLPWINSVRLNTTLDYNGLQWTTMDYNGPQWTTMDQKVDRSDPNLHIQCNKYQRYKIRALSPKIFCKHFFKVSIFYDSCKNTIIYFSPFWWIMPDEYGQSLVWTDHHRKTNRIKYKDAWHC